MTETWRKGICYCRSLETCKICIVRDGFPDRSVYTRPGENEGIEHVAAVQKAAEEINKPEEGNPPVQVYSRENAC